MAMSPWVESEPDSITEHDRMVSAPGVSYAGWLSPAMPDRPPTSMSAPGVPSTDASRRTTRTATAGRAPRWTKSPLLVAGHVIESPETAFKYEVERLLGEGGFGQVYLARRLGPSGPPRLGRDLLTSVDRYRGGRPCDDDVTLLVLHHNGGGPRRLSLGEKLDVYTKVFGLKSV